jgi:tetratricopeptide (TPR) repeat protein
MRALAAIALVCALVGPAAAGPETVLKVMNLLEASRLDEAGPLIEAERGKGMSAFLRGARDLYAGRYAEAADSLGRAIDSGELDPRLAPEAAAMRELAQHTGEVTKGFVARRSAHFEIKVAPGKDELLAEPALEALEKALTQIGGDLGETPPAPIRVEIYGEVADLARVSPLTVAEIETSGTIALCKYNRLMATSPRALVAGYPWLDTLSHELTHFLVNRASRNSVPIWLHEGIAKLEERRWREPFGGALAPTLEHLLASGLRQGHLIPFSAMHPSMAKLPSQEDAGLAFAEVTTAIQYLTEGRGAAPLRKLLAALRDGADLDRAIQAVTGVGFARFEQRWRTWVKGRGFRTHPELGLNRLRFVAAAGDKAKAKEGKHDDEEASEHGAARTPGEAKGRGHVRLGTMLRSRGRLAAAAVEYERAQQLLGAGHPDVAGRLGRTYLELKQWDRAIAAARPGVERRPESAGLRVTVGRALLEKGDPAAARPFLEGALAVNPYDPATRCGLRRVYQALSDGRAEREAAACETLGGAR